MAKRHYQTRHIVGRIRRNTNGYATLHFGVRMSRDTDDEPARPNAKLSSDLDAIFSHGGELVLETQRDWDDEGGECYEAFIVAPIYLEAYHKAYDEAFNPPAAGPNKRDPDLLFIHRYLAENPEQFWHVWAGPY